MATRTIRFSLDASSISNAIRELERYRDDLRDAIQELVRELMSEGRDIAVQNVVRLAYDTGELAGSIHTRGYFSEDLCMGIIYADAYYAVFVEYGTGIVGKTGPQHPFLPAGWEHDHNHHGDAGWVYVSDRDGKPHWTKGQPSKPFMYNTYMELIRLAQEKFNSMRL